MAATSVHLCLTPECGKPAGLQCPTCMKLGIEGSFFCSQECFKGSWSNHKLMHKKAADSSDTTTSTFNPWPWFEFTGRLRPFLQTPRRTVPAHISRPDYAASGIPESERESKRANVMKILSPTEIQGMRTACKYTREVLDLAAAAVKPGVTGDEIDRIVHEACIERNCYPSPLNYVNFPKSCCVSVNEVICHGIPDERELEDGDICNVDISVYHNGYHGDANETFFVGKSVDDASRHLVKAAYECMMKGIAIVHPGERYRNVGNEIQKHAQLNDVSVVRTYCGHGINQLFHTLPNVPHYSKNKAVGIMKAGHTFTIEPMINQGTWQDVTWPDEWTAVTADGKWSAQFEHTLLVTDTGCDILTLRTDNDGMPHFMTQQ